MADIDHADAFLDAGGLGQQHRPAHDEEEVCDPLLLQAFSQDLRSGQFGHLGYLLMSLGLLAVGLVRPLDQITPSRRSPSTSSVPRPSHSPSTSSLCWPSSGAGEIGGGLPSKGTGQAGILYAPPFGCWIGCRM